MSIEDAACKFKEALNDLIASGQEYVALRDLNYDDNLVYMTILKDIDNHNNMMLKSLYNPHICLALNGKFYRPLNIETRFLEDDTLWIPRRVLEEVGLEITIDLAIEAAEESFDGIVYILDESEYDVIVIKTCNHNGKPELYTVNHRIAPYISYCLDYWLNRKIDRSEIKDKRYKLLRLVTCKAFTE